MHKITILFYIVSLLRIGSPHAQPKYKTALNLNKSINNGIIKHQKKVLWFELVTVIFININARQPANGLPYDIYDGGQQTTDASQFPLSGIVL